MDRPSDIRFSAAAGLGLPFRRFREDPWRALRLTACDTGVIGGASILIARTLPDGSFAGAQGGLAAAALLAMLAYLVWMPVSLSAWIRYLAGRERPGLLPHRLGADEIRLVGLYAVALLIAVPPVFVLAIPGFVIQAAGGQAFAGLWIIPMLGLVGWFFARFVPVPARVVLSGSLLPFHYWQETHPMRGRLREALLGLAVVYGACALAVVIAGGLAEIPYAVVLAQFDMNASEVLRDLVSSELKAVMTATAIAALVSSWLCRLMLRGIAVHAALVIEAGGEPAPDDSLPVPAGAAAR